MLFFNIYCEVYKVKLPKFHWKNKEIRVTKQMKERLIIFNATLEILPR